MPERSAQREPPEPEPPAVTGRVTSWNIGRGAPGTQGADWDQLDEVADVIAAGNSDVVVLQEVFVSDVETIVDHLEDEHGLSYHAKHVEADEKNLVGRDRSDNFWDELRHVTSPVPEAFGQATLSLEPITSTTRHELPDDGDEARVVMEAQTTINGAPVRVFDTHLSTHDEGRDEQIPAAFEAARGSEVPAVFAGDFNTRASEVMPAAEQRGFEQAEPDGPTACGPGDTPRSDLDHIYVRGAEPSRPSVGQCAPSDHAPVGVDVTLPGWFLGVVGPAQPRQGLAAAEPGIALPRSPRGRSHG